MATTTDTILSWTRLRIAPRRASYPKGVGARLSELAAERGRTLSVGIARFDGIGDWVLTLPLVQAISGSASVSSTTVIAPAPLRGLLERGVVDRFIPYSGGTILAPPPPGGLVGKIRAVSWLTGRVAFREGTSHGVHVDVVILPRWDTDLGSNARAWAAGSRAVILGFDPSAVPGTTAKERRERDLLTEAVRDAAPGAHEIEHLRSMLSALGLPDEIRPGYGADYFGVTRAVGALDSGKPYVVFHALSNEPKRRWPSANWRQLAGLVIRATDLDVVLIGSAGERGRLLSIADGLGDRVHVRADVPLGRLPELLASADSFIGGDSGPLHVASSIGVPVVMISPHPREGNPAHRNSPVRFGPFGDPAEVLQPASGLGKCVSSCTARTAHCITVITATEVFESFLRVRGGA